MEPISLSLIQAGRDLTEPRLSPDGTSVAFVQRWRGGSSINVLAAAGDGVERQLTFGPDPAPGRGLGGGCFVWLSETSIAYVAVDGELWLQDGGELRQLTGHGRSVRAPSVTGRQLAYAIDEAEVWLLDLDAGTSRQLDDGRHEFCFDPAVSPDGGSVSWQGWSPPDMPWDGAVRVDHDVQTGDIVERELPDGAFQQPRFAVSGEPMHVHDGSGWLNVYLGERAVVAEAIEHAGPTWGMGNRSYALDAAGKRLAFTRNEGGHGALCVVDVETGAVDQLGRGVHGHLTWVGDSIVALRSGARTPTQIVRYGAHDGRRSTLAVSQPAAWSGIDLPEPELVEVTSASGVTLHARRFVADSSAIVGSGRMLCWVHGGPTDQWQVEWRPRITYWLSRGWDVLVVDPRGTTGHGREYQQALHGGWGRLDVDDTAELIDHAHAMRWATPASTVIIGGSSGGLTVVGVLADHSALVAGGVASYPVTDLRVLTMVTHRFEAHYTDTLVAPNDGSAASRARFAELSPINRVATIESPLLLFHGSDDPVVPIEQSDALVERIVASGGDVSYVVYEGEGHGFRQPAHVTDEYERTEAFLQRVVGSRS